MATYVHRDNRLALIERAQFALDMAEPGIIEDPAREDLRRLLANQADALKANRFEASDEYAEAQLAVWQSEKPDELQNLGRTDPVRAATLVIPPAVGTLLGFLLTTDPAPRNSPFHEIGVLLPLRLETLFEEGEDGIWTLLLRILPDEASIRRDRPTMSRAEFTFLSQFWARSAELGAPTDKPEDWLRAPGGRAAFADLAARTSPQRAAYLASSFAPTVQAGVFSLEEPAGRVGETESDRIFGLPEELIVSIEDGNKGRIDLGVIEPKLPEGEFGIPKDKDAFDHWMFSWPRAQEVGMGKSFALPDGVRPDTIQALYVCGIGSEGPAALFTGHAEAGDMALLRLGAPTNTVHGAPAADLGQDAEAWADIAANRIAGLQAVGSNRLGQTLCGKQALPFIPGGSEDIADDQLMVQALAPALWGHWMRDIWGALDGWLPCWQWGVENIHPEGPFLPIRIGAQPYGLLPVTAYDRWEPSGKDIADQLELRLLNILKRALPDWTRAGEAGGTIVGGDTDKLLDNLARSGVSRNYLYRTFLDADRLGVAYPDPGVFWNRTRQFWFKASQAIGDIVPERRYLAIGDAQPLQLPLIGSDRLFPLDMTFEKLLEILYQVETEIFAEELYNRTLNGIVPRSLLARLMIQSVLLAKAWFVQGVIGETKPLLNPADFDAERSDTLVETRQVEFRDAFAGGRGAPELQNFVETHQAACFDLAKRLDLGLGKAEDPVRRDGSGVTTLELNPETQARLERSLRATFDCAGHRIDTYATAIPYRRLVTHTASGRARRRLGAYGWLDGPFLGQPGPTASGRIHAPSQAQAMTGIILRDKYLSSAQEAAGGLNVWDMNLSSQVVRIATAIADELRMGFHLFEVVGRRVEAIVAAPDRIRALRLARPMRGPNDRDSCHGPNALADLQDDALPGILSDLAEERTTQLDALTTLDRALAAHADLTLAEGVFQVVSGNPARAADAVDAGSGLGRPVAFEVMRTPPSGYRLASSVLAVLPFVEPGGGLPIEQADASLAGFLGAQFSDPAQFIWTARMTDGASQSVALTDLGIAPLEALTMTEDFLADAVRSHLRQPKAVVTGATLHKLMRSLAGFLGTPAEAADVTRDPQTPDDVQKTSVTGIGADLAARYKALRDALSDLMDEGAAAADDEARLTWLRQTLPWGFTGVQVEDLRAPLCDILFGALPADANIPVDQVIAQLTHDALKFLGDRRDRVVAEVDPTKQNSVAALSRAIAELVSPGGRLCLTSRWDKSALMTASALKNDAALAGAEVSWVSPLAAVRPPLARLEAAQLQASCLAQMQPLMAWANTGDLWRTDLVAANAELRRTGTTERQAGGQPKLDLSRLVVAFGPQQAWAGDDVAVAVIDHFTEVMPVPERTGTVGFGFNAPASRPPQAILLAVPPRAEGGLDDAVLLDILADTRKLVRARAARTEHVGNQGLLPAMWFDAASPLQLRLDGDSQFHR